MFRALGTLIGHACGRRASKVHQEPDRQACCTPKRASRPFRRPPDPNRLSTLIRHCSPGIDTAWRTWQSNPLRRVPLGLPLGCQRWGGPEDATGHLAKRPLRDALRCLKCVGRNFTDVRKVRSQSIQAAAAATCPPVRPCRVGNLYSATLGSFPYAESIWTSLSSVMLNMSKRPLSSASSFRTP